MATFNSNFPSLAAIDAAGDKVFTAMTLESATTWAHTAFDNANDLAVSYYVGTPTSTYVVAVLTNGDSIQVYGSNLLGYPQTVTKMVYTVNGQDLTVTLEGSVQFASELADPTGYVDKFIVTSDSSVVTANGYINVASDAPATFTSIDLVYGTATLHATGNLSVTDTAVVTGNLTGVTVSDGAMSFSVSGLNMAYDTAMSFETMTAFLTSALAGNDQVNGTAASEYLVGYAGGDALNGGLGADTLNGGPGADTMTGGDGSDLYLVDHVGDLVVESNAAPTGGTDLVYSFLLGTYFLDANIENGRVATAVASHLTGNALNNLLYAGAGNNILDGGTGIDTASYLYATGAINASLAVATAQATGGSGSDTLLSIENLSGSNFADNLTGNAQANRLEGGLGDDVLNGGAGNDSLFGGTGQDTASYSGAAAGVIASVFTMTATGGAGADTLNAIEHLTGSAFGDKLTGNHLSNRIDGGAGNDTLSGGGGADSMIGGDGLDTYAVDHAADQVIESNALAPGGADLVNSYLGAYSLTANVENGRILNAAAANLTGNELGNTLFAGAGDNILDGGAGIDTVSYLYAAAAVNASLAIVGAQTTGGSGSDSFIGVERLSGSNFADNLTGDAAVNVLTGGNGNDTLSAGAGNDLLIGGLGQDSLTGGTGADRFDYNAANESGINNSTWDRIADFQGALGDKVDLATIDADTATAGDQAFSAPVNSATAFSATATFTAAGQLYFDQTAHVLYGNTDADAAAEFAIELVGVSSVLLAHLAA